MCGSVEIGGEGRRCVRVMRGHCAARRTLIFPGRSPRSQIPLLTKRPVVQSQASDADVVGVEDSVAEADTLPGSHQGGGTAHDLVGWQRKGGLEGRLHKGGFATHDLGRQRKGR